MTNLIILFYEWLDLSLRGCGLANYKWSQLLCLNDSNVSMCLGNSSKTAILEEPFNSAL